MTKQLNIAVLRFYDHERSQVLGGGMERWCRDVAYLAREYGYQVTIYQKDEVPFEAELAQGVRAVGVSCPPNWRGHWTFSRWLERHVSVDEPLLYVSMELALSGRFKRAAGVQHGIWWTGDFPWYKQWLNRRLQRQLITRLRGVIAVDTNYINWCHAHYPNRVDWEQKLTYVPNYADPELFGVLPEPAPTDGLPNILFPRRATGTRYPGKQSMLDRSSRGAGLFLKALEILEREGTQVRATFVGRGPVQDEILAWAKAHDMADRVAVTEVTLEEMPNQYAQANVVVVPSIEREGTSLAAVEAMMCGIPTVVTHIGGLGNIVIDGLNGFICDLTPESLAEGIGRGLAARRLPTGQTLTALRQSLGKPRWEGQVWGHLSRWLELD